MSSLIKMVNANDLKINIINLITKINDVDKLKMIYNNLEEVNQSTKGITLNDTTIELREGVSFQQILDEQNYRPISYEEFRKIADDIEWDHSLEELLEQLD